MTNSNFKGVLIHALMLNYPIHIYGIKDDDGTHHYNFCKMPIYQPEAINDAVCEYMENEGWEKTSNEVYMYKPYPCDNLMYAANEWRQKICPIR